MNINKYCSDSVEKENKGHDKFKAQHHSNRRWNGPGEKATFAFIVIVVAIVVIGLALIVPMLNKGAKHTAIIKIPQGATTNQVKDSVAKYLGEDYAHDLRQAMEITGGGDIMRHGAYKIEEGMTPMQGSRVLTHGGQTGIRVTIQNERDKEAIAKKFAAKLDISADELLKLMNDPERLKQWHTDPDNIMNIFLGDTYEFYWTATPEEIIEKMYKNYRSFWNDNRRKRAEELHLSPREVEVLASIVDEETNQMSEKGMIGRLYINRIRKKMKLQADPTVRFALGDFSIKRITNEMTKTDSPYNTYVNEGLPPGPIRTTSAGTIDAILSCQPHPYYYMCAKEDFSGFHNFAETYEKHLENARRYQAALDKKGIK